MFSSNLSTGFKALTHLEFTLYAVVSKLHTKCVFFLHSFSCRNCKRYEVKTESNRYKVQTENVIDIRVQTEIVINKEFKQKM